LTTAELLDIEPHKLRNAFAVARQECKFFPKPCEIFEFIKRDRTLEVFLRTGPVDLQDQLDEQAKARKS
jgi:hypothetical protein